MIEHDPWAPTVGGGIEQQPIAIMGYSHYYRSGTSDSELLTRDVVNLVLKGKLDRNPFFSRIPGYFGLFDPKDFWPRVFFFNFLPSSVGGPNKKYATGTHEQVELARRRFNRILSENVIDKVFVFTTKGWNECPCTDGGCLPLYPPKQLLAWGTYTFGRRKILACGFPHPQYANVTNTRTAVRRFMRM